MAETLRVGIAGLGAGARQVLPGFKRVPGVQLAAVADVRSSVLDEFRARGVAAFDSVEAMCRSNEVDAVWVANDNNYDSSSAMRCNVVLASRDPFAVDWYASEYILRPVVPDYPDESSLARAGTFRTASMVNQKAAKNTWVGTYPSVDFVTGYSGNTPLEAEKNQMNVFLASASPSPLPAIFNTLLGD